MKHTMHRLLPKKLRRAQPAICPLRAAAFLAGSLADCPAGSWPMPVLKPKERLRENPGRRRKPLPPLATQSPDRCRKRLKMKLNRPAMTLN
jgi:hypothetical protein